VVEDFKRAAKCAFPREAYGLLIGHDDPGLRRRKVTVSEIYIPEDVTRHCTPQGTDVQLRWIIEAAQRAKEAGAEVVGEIHSHPWTYAEWKASGRVPERHMSESDQDRVMRNKVSGICRVYETRTGKLRASVRFWPPVVPVKLLLKRSL
jgi:hypothetical protein